MTEYQGSRQAFLAALHRAVAAAPEKERNVLSQCLEDYAYRWPRSYQTMTQGVGLIAEVLSVLEESSDARIHKTESGLPFREK